MTDLYAVLLSGHYVEAAAGAYTSLIGNWFWLIIFGFGLAMVQMKTNDFSVTALVGILISSLVMSALPGPAKFVGYVLMALGATIILYRVSH